MNDTAKESPQPKSRKILFNVLSVALALVVLSILAAFGFFLWCEMEYGSPVLPEDGLGLRVYDRQNKLVFTGIEDRFYSPIPLANISKNLQYALVVSEDRDFYRHHGVSFWGIGRALFADLTTGHLTQGGSTLTQQLIKNLYFPEEQHSIWRKLPEAAMSMQLEQRYSKQQIMAAYLNYVYFGRGTYGVEEAAQRYFGKDASQLNLAESAYLAGLVNAPSALSANKKDAVARAHEIIDNMVKLGYVPAASAEKAKLQKLTPQSLPTVEDRCGYYLNHVLKEVQQDLNDEEPWRDGIAVYTNLDVAAQIVADKTLSAGIRKAPAGVTQGALVSVSVVDCGVITMIGGIGTVDKSPWDRATSPHTTGSAFKPFVYLAGLISGVLKPDTTLDDSPIAIQDPGTNKIWAPKDFERDYLGPITIRKALALSRNICAVRVAQAIGPEKIVDVARLAGITSKLDPTLALALGASAVSPLEMAEAYATLARGGVHEKPIFVRRLVSRNGKVLMESNVEAKQVFDPEPVAQLVDAMQDVVQKGTGTHAQLFGRPVAGKTGTADGAKDIWFIGFTPDTVTAVWGGNDENKAIKGNQVTGGRIMAGIWQNYMKQYYQTHPTPVLAFAPPQQPLAQEVDQIHYIPEPAGIFGKIANFLDPKDFPLNKQDEMPPVAPDRYSAAVQSETHGEENSSPKKSNGKTGKIGRFFKKMFKLF